MVVARIWGQRAAVVFVYPTEKRKTALRVRGVRRPPPASTPCHPPAERRGLRLARLLLAVILAGPRGGFAH